MDSMVKQNKSTKELISDDIFYSGTLESSKGVPGIVDVVSEPIPWPGAYMTDEGNGILSYEVFMPESKDNNIVTRVMFNNGSNQIPPSGQSGFILENKTIMIWENSDWKKIGTTTEDAIAKIKIPYNWYDSKCYVYHETLIGPDLYKMRLKWNIRKSSNSGYNIFSVNMFFYHKNTWNGRVYGQDNSNNGTYISINGNQVFLNTTTDVSGDGGEYFVMSHEVEVPIYSNITISAGCDIGQATINNISWNKIEDSFQIYTGPEVFPSTPFKISTTGKYEINSTIVISFTNSTGTITGYEIQCSTYDFDLGWSSWKTIADNHQTLSVYHTITEIGINTNAIKYRVRARNENATSSWSTESNVLKHYGIKTYQQNSFRWAVIKIFNGNDWEDCDVKRWDGNNWVANNQT